MLKNILLVISILLLTSCSAIFSKIYGVKELNKFDKQEYDSFISKLKTENIMYFSLISDPASFRKSINLGDSVLTQKDLYQPIQILYFEKNQIVSFQANCYAKGTLKNLNWNYDNRFSIFPPKSAVPLNNERNVTFKEFNEIYPELKNIKGKKYSIIIFWTSMLENISYDAIETVFENIVKFDKTHETVVYLINTDKFFISLKTAHNSKGIAHAANHGSIEK